MLLALDVHYEATLSRVGRVAFEQWDSPEPLWEDACLAAPAGEYRSGEFYLRELPALLEALKGHDPRVVVVDGHCWLGCERPGLGAHLFRAAEGRFAVVGVAKSAFHGSPSLPVLRGQSRRPLYVSACGLEARVAADRVASMAGQHRLPGLLKRVDHWARGVCGAMERGKTCP